MACTDEGARKREEKRGGEGVSGGGERARTPRAAVTAGTTSAMRQPTAFNVALRRPVVAPGTIRRLANAGGNGGGDIKDVAARRPA